MALMWVCLVKGGLQIVSQKDSLVLKMAPNQKQANGPAKPSSENDGEGAVKK